MSIASLDEEKLKHLLKSALIEVLQEQRDLFQEIIGEAIEDVGLKRAIEEGLESETVARAKIFKVLDVAQ